LSCAIGGRIAAADGATTAEDGRAVVVTASVVPETEHVPAGIEQAAVSVGFALKPLTLIWNVNVLPAEPDCDGCDGASVGGAVKVAMTLVFALSAKVQTGLVLAAQAPDQLVNVAPLFGTAVNVIAVPDANDVPVGDWVIVPGPFTLVASVYCGAVKVADTVSFAVTITLHVVEFVVAQAPPQFEKVAPGFETAVRFTVVLFANDVPAGDCVIVPGPTTLVENVNFVTVVTPVPVNVAPVSDPPGPLIPSVAARPPKACGANVTVIEHDDPTAIGAAVQLLVAEKSPGFEPPIVIEDTVIGPVPVNPFCN
jgi:hypothetical protein